MKPDIQRCLEILELRQGAGLEEVKQAHKDLVRVWHPDRFTANPRLRQKAEERTKEVNRAYETLVGYLDAREKDTQDFETSAPRHGGGAQGEKKDGTEAVFELGTELFLRACHFVYTSTRRLVAEPGRGKKGKGSS